MITVNNVIVYMKPLVAYSSVSSYETYLIHIEDDTHTFFVGGSRPNSWILMKTSHFKDYWVVSK